MALSGRKSAQLLQGEWAQGETWEPIAVVQVMRPGRGDGVSVVPSALLRAASAVVPAGQGGQDDLRLTARGRCSEGPGAGWKRGWLQPAKGKQKYLLSCKDKLTRSCLPHKAGMTLTWGRGSITSSPHSPGSAPPTSGLGAGQKPCPSSFLPRPSPLRSEVSNRDPFPPFLLSSHPTPPILSSFLV